MSKVDTYDADAVLEEMQMLEEVMERVQSNLVKKLGNEVGVQGIGTLFKEAERGALDSPTDGAPAKDIGGPKTNSGKSYLTSWRKLRGKNSVAGTSSITSSTISGRSGERESNNMSTVPMTTFSGVEKRTAHRREALRDAVFEGPHKEYMAATARLCEAAQAIGKSNHYCTTQKQT